MSLDLRGRTGRLVRTLLYRLTDRLAEPRVIWDRAGLSPYLSRWYLYGSRPGVERTGPVAVFLHRFHRGDDDMELHSHPWAWSLAIILAGGYKEERRIHAFGRSWVTLRTWRPGDINFIRGEDYHRVDLLEDDSWSLFIAGPHAGDWYFWNRHTDETTFWKTFIARKRGERVDEVRLS